MGNTKGAIYNQSDFDIKYYFYSAFEEMTFARTETTINPQLSLDIYGEVKIKGFKRKADHESVFTYEHAMVQVPAGRISTMGLGNIQPGKCKLTIVAMIDDYQKLLFKNVTISTLTDARIKIRNDLSFKKVENEQFAQIIRDSKKVTNALNPMPEINLQRKQKIIRYIEHLKRKDEQNRVAMIMGGVNHALLSNNSLRSENALRSQRNVTSQDLISNSLETTNGENFRQEDRRKIFQNPKANIQTNDGIKHPRHVQVEKTDHNIVCLQELEKQCAIY